MIVSRTATLALLTVFTCAGWTQTAARPPITGIAYVRFFESDLPAAKAFYGQRLGLPETDEANGGATFAIGASQQVKIAALPSPAPADRIDEVAFFTSDVPAMKRFLAAHAVAFEALSPTEIRLKDPAGYRVGFVENKHPYRTAAAVAPVTSRRMIHAGWRVNDRAVEDDFYVKLLGFRPYWYGGMDPVKRIDWVSLQVPEGTDWIEYMLGFPANPDARELGVLNHISLGVNKITDADQQLLANGMTDPTKRKSQIGKDGKWQLNVFDPDLTRVEYMEFTPVREPCCSPFTAPNPAPEPVNTGGTK